MLSGFKLTLCVLGALLLSGILAVVVQSFGGRGRIHEVPPGAGRITLLEARRDRTLVFLRMMTRGKNSTIPREWGWGGKDQPFVQTIEELGIIKNGNKTLVDKALYSKFCNVRSLALSGPEENQTLLIRGDTYLARGKIKSGKMINVTVITD